MNLDELSERLARLEAAEARRDPDAWPATRVFPETLAWNEPEPLPWETAATSPDPETPGDQPYPT